MSRRNARLSPRARRSRLSAGTERAAGSRVERSAVRIAQSSRGARDLRAAAKTGIDEALRIEAGERRRIVVAMLALPARGRGIAKPEPGEIIDDSRLELGLAARPVQVLDAQKHAPAELGRDALVHERRIGVAEVKPAVRRRREAQDRRGREGVIAHGG